MPRDKWTTFGQQYGEVQRWRGHHRKKLLNLSELEILMVYNAESRGFLNYYSLADNMTSVAGSILWLTTKSFLKTVANKRRSSVKRVAQSLQKGPNQFVITHKKRDGSTKDYVLVSSTKYLNREKVAFNQADKKPNTWRFKGRTELGQRLLANQCEWCQTRQGTM